MDFIIRKFKVLALGFFSLLVIAGYYMARASYDPGTVNMHMDAPPAVGLANATRKMYVIMFDAGSTGSRIHAYEFIKDNLKNKISLRDELFEYIKPGLSSYADKPKEGAESLRALIESAKKYIPKNEWAATPLALKATAGLRMLPTEKSENILNEVREFLRGQPFRPEKNVVEIMGGIDEGVYSWFTINFLKGFLDHGASTVGVIDLGGGSVQITFLPSEGGNTRSTAPKEHLHKIPVMKREVDIYSHSYLGLGLMAARMQIFGRDPTVKEAANTELRSVCLPPGSKTEWTFQGTKFAVGGETTSSFEQCYKTAQAVVARHNVFAPAEMKNRASNLISYFYDTAADSGMIDEEKGGSATIEDFSKTAAKICADHVAEAKLPFLCMDLSYIVALLRDGWRFGERTKFALEKKINGIETAWTLGAAYQLL